MKKTFTTLFIVSCFYGLASAQVKEKGDIEYGVEAGFTNSYIGDDNTGEHTDVTTGFSAGAFADFYFSNRWSLKIKPQYYQKGWGNGYLSFDDGTEIDYVDYKVNYITIPVLANWHFGRRRNWYLDFGPYVGILTSAHAGGYDVKDGINSTDAGLAFDIGVKIPISNNAKFFIEYGGQEGVTNPVKDNPGIQNFSDGLNIGISF